MKHYCCGEITWPLTFGLSSIVYQLCRRCRRLWVSEGESTNG